MGIWGGEKIQQGNSWRTWAGEVAAGGMRDPTFVVQINREEQLGSKTDHTTQDSTTGKRNPQNLWL